MRVHVFVHGDVQGVFFRDFTQKKANGLTGFVRNTNDSVEIIAEGSKEKLEELIAAVKQGPSSANVKDVEVKWKKAMNEFSTFEIK